MLHGDPEPGRAFVADGEHFTENTFARARRRLAQARPLCLGVDQAAAG